MATPPAGRYLQVDDNAGGSIGGRWSDEDLGALTNASPIGAKPLEVSGWMETPLVRWRHRRLDKSPACQTDAWTVRSDQWPLVRNSASRIRASPGGRKRRQRGDGIGGRIAAPWVGCAGSWWRRSATCRTGTPAFAGDAGGRTSRSVGASHPRPLTIATSRTQFWYHVASDPSVGPGWLRGLTLLPMNHCE